MEEYSECQYHNPLKARPKLTCMRILGLEIAPKTFSALRHRNFRLFWVGQWISLTGTWMQSIAQGWLVFEITNSSFKLGLVSTLSTLPVLLLTLVGGVVADKMNKRKLLLATQTTVMCLAFALASLVYFDVVEYWHIVILACMQGIVMAFDAPARQSFFVEMVGKEDLMNAIALNSTIFNAARILGPAVAGILIATVGVGGCFFLNGVSFLAVIMGLLLMRGDFSPSYTITGSVIENIKEGVRYMWDDKKIISYISIIATTSIFGMPYLMLMPVFARDYLHVGPQGLGTLMASVGMGALVAALMLATLGDFEKKGFLMLAGGITFTVALTTFSFSGSYPFSLFLLILSGWGMITQTATINTLLQTRVPDNMRGRVMSAFTLTFMGFQPFGSFQAGVLAQQLGAPMAVRIGGIACGLVLLLLLVRRRDVYTS